MTLTALAVVCVVGLLTTIAADRLIGLVAAPRLPLIFPPNSEVVYETTEFRFTATINADGFRDREFARAKGHVCRGVAIGDSFTYGWGVAVEESWPKVVERMLQAEGHTVEIANLGFPGGSPIDYADIAERAVPRLRPDFVIVGMLQGDDLAQLRFAGKTPSVAHEPPGVGIGVLAAFVATAYPHLARVAAALIRRPGRRTTRLIATAWKRQAEEIVGGLTPAQRVRYDALDDGVRAAFMDGHLNPALVNLALSHPDYFEATHRPEHGGAAPLVAEMANQLRRIRRVADGYGARVLVASIPFGLYVDAGMLARWQRYGFVIDRAMLTSDAEDRAIATAAAQAGTPFFTATADFRSARGARFFFPLDGHLDAGGHRLYADRLARELGRPGGLVAARCGG